MSDIEELEQVTRIAGDQVEEEKKQGLGTSLDPTGGGEFAADLIDDAVDLVGSMFRGAANAGATVLQGATDVGGTILEGAAQVGSAVVENAPGVGEAAVEVVGTILSGLADS